MNRDDCHDGYDTLALRTPSLAFLQLSSEEKCSEGAACTRSDLVSSTAGNTGA
ncbi:MAG: hypothetical protein ACXQTM_01570 [Methanosarcinales archaeon]